MIKEKSIAKCFRTLVKNGGQLTRTQLSKRVFGGDRTKEKLNELLQPLLVCGLVDFKKSRVRGRGRAALRYFLTLEGWKIARAFKLPISVERINPEEVMHQFALLVGDRYPWAFNMEREASAWRAHDAAEKQKREEKAAADREWREKHPGEKRPSAGRRGNETARDPGSGRFTRSPNQESTRVPDPTFPAAPTSSPARTSTAQSSAGIHGGSGGFRTSGPTVKRPALPPVIPQSWGGAGEENEKPLDPKDLELAKRIKDLGLFTVVGTEVSTGLGMRPASEWIKSKQGDYPELWQWWKKEIQVK